MTVPALPVPNDGIDICRHWHLIGVSYFTMMANVILHRPPLFNPTTQVVS